MGRRGSLRQDPFEGPPARPRSSESVACARLGARTCTTSLSIPGGLHVSQNGGCVPDFDPGLQDIVAKLTECGFSKGGEVSRRGVLHPIGYETLL